MFRNIETGIFRGTSTFGKPLVVSAIREVCAEHGRLSNYYSILRYASSDYGSRRKTCSADADVDLDVD